MPISLKICVETVNIQGSHFHKWKSSEYEALCSYLLRTIPSNDITLFIFEYPMEYLVGNLLETLAANGKLFGINKF